MEENRLNICFLKKFFVIKCRHFDTHTRQPHPVQLYILLSMYVLHHRMLKLLHSVLNAACSQPRCCACFRLYALIYGNKHRVDFNIRVPLAGVELFIQRHCLKCRHNLCKVPLCRCAVMPCGKNVGGICNLSVSSGPCTGQTATA